MSEKSTMTRRRFLFSAVGLAASATLLSVLPLASARAQTSEELRASGRAGERWDGYMEARDASARGAVDAINAQRRDVYARRAAQENAPVEEVGKVYAQQILRSAPSGTWFLDERGRWTQK